MIPRQQPARVLVTRPLEQADNLCRLIREQGGEPVLFPVLTITPLTPQITHTAVINQINRYDWVLFVSANAVRYACVDLHKSALQINDKVQIAVLGKATATALKTRAWPVHSVPERNFTSEALLATQAFQQIKGQRFLLIKGQGGRDKLAYTLTQRGAVVDYLEVYRRIKPIVNTSVRNQALARGSLDVIVLTSSEALQNLLDVAGEKIAILLKSVPLVVISHRIRKIAEKLGFNRVLVSDEPSDTAIVKTIKTLIK